MGRIAAWFLRLWAVAVAIVYAVAMVTTGSLWTSSDQWAAPMLFPFLVAAAVFALTVLDRGLPEASLAPPAVSWVVMLVGALAVLPSEILVIALLVSAAPAVFVRRRVGPARTPTATLNSSGHATAPPS